MPLPTPNASPDVVTRTFTLPVDLSPFLTGAILTLARVNGWEPLGDRSPVECADIFYKLLTDEMPP